MFPVDPATSRRVTTLFPDRLSRFHPETPDGNYLGNGSFYDFCKNLTRQNKTEAKQPLKPVKLSSSARIFTLAASWTLLLACQAEPGFALENPQLYPVLPSGYSSIKVFDRRERFVGRVLSEKRYWTPLNRIPLFLQQGVIAVEDSRFYEHPGVDVRGIARALVKDVTEGRFAEGGSTITQQLVKNRYLSGVKTFERKFEEARMAMEFEKKYSKKQILEMYFNEIYYGKGAWGIAQAARLYFDKNPEELTDPECSMLAGVQKNPARYNPLGKPANIIARRDVVLKRMAALGMITERRRKELRANPPTVVKPGNAPQYISLVREKLIAMYGEQITERGGMQVTAALDLELQKKGEQALRDGVKRIAPDLEGALLCMETTTGDILAVAGGTNPEQNDYNRAFYARRQPGSSVKPFIYAAALEKGFTASTIMDDTPVTYDMGGGKSWTPHNYGGESFGKLSLRRALALSSNIIAIKLLDSLGIPYFVDFAARNGLKFNAGNGLSLALGAEEVTIREMVQAYSAFATGGERVEGRVIIRVYDRNSRRWTEYPAPKSPAISPEASFITTQMLKDVMIYGSAKSLEKFSQKHVSAGKTGTTDDYRDAWFIGYTPKIVTGVWIGYDMPKPSGKRFTGGSAAAPVWEKFMRAALASRADADFVKPENVFSVSIDPETGYLSVPECRSRRDEYYIRGSEPKEECPVHGGGRKPPGNADDAEPGDKQSGQPEEETPASEAEGFSGGGFSPLSLPLQRAQ